MTFARILSFETLPSTQIALKEYLHQHIDAALPICFLADRQSSGIGSRNNQWQSVENAWTFSFALDLDVLPKDLPLQSCSIYFGFVFKEWLRRHGFEVWLKWPNDLYIDTSKAGGVITQVIGTKILCGIGLNLQSQSYKALGVEWNLSYKKEMLEDFLQFLFVFPTWKQIFKEYKLEFYKNFDFSFHDKNNRKIRFAQAVLCDDGSICVDEEYYFGSR
ncbi:biotin--[acetyl-CoA-carboxylase] ligase [Helicobacter enhydrae]|uniref:Biotin--[acetyl-CoA-carboxylase] ligase n=1 Tax=Helicobacter enhydrae TaxID=222136 RepID=A0A1B1U6R3_9HELI|nr:biotin--[acetyl-CoA-carboxylase] ligase [Helicobacter enhydrae]ANV98449.1 biotin--[acetyl-CoA-carboxylase] ligase [Helicobacter enhydrae]